MYYRRRSYGGIIAKIIIIIVMFFIGYTIGRASNQNQIVLDNAEGQKVVASLPENADQFLEGLGIGNIANVSSGQVSGIIDSIRNSSFATYLEGVVGGFLNILRDVGINIGR